MNIKRFILFYMLLLAVSTSAQQVTLVYLEHSNTLSFNKDLHPNAKFLNGDVRFRHDEALMYCDSAYFDETRNAIEAYGHIRLVQGDTLMGFCDILYYDGNTKMARMRHHVRLIHNEMVITTDSLNYNRADNLAYYFTGGQIVDTVNTLTSRWGQYNPPSRQAIFKTNVHLTNENFTLDADTLIYNTETNITQMVGPTAINYQDSTNIYASLGWYNTRTEESELLKDSRVEHSDGKILTGDTIFYNKKIGYGRVQHQMCFTDPSRNASLSGNYGEIWKDGNHGYVTDHALFREYSGDTLYVHADTLFTEEIPYRISQIITPDTLWKDTTYQQVRAYYKVRIYRDDMQAICDSMSYNLRDSILNLYMNPVCWSNEQQISADSIHAFMKNSTLDYAHGIGKAMSVKQEDTDYFNQLSGKEIFAYIRDGELREVHVNGNAETVFYPVDEGDGSFVGVNKTESSNVRLFFNEQKIDHILFTTATTGTMYPLDSISPAQVNLPNFFWAEDKRPKSPEDIFPQPTVPTISPTLETEAVEATEPENPIEIIENKERKTKKSKHKQSTLKH